MFFLSDPTWPVRTRLATSRASFFLSAFRMETSMLGRLSLNRMLEQLPRSLPSQVSSLLATHSLEKVCDSFFDVQHLLVSHI